MTTEYRWESHAEAGVKLELPTDWTMGTPELELENSKVAVSPDRQVTLEFSFITRGAVEVAHDERAMLQALDKVMTDVVVTHPASHAMQHGLHVFGVRGKGQLKGRTAEWMFLAFGDGKGHGLLLNVLANAGVMATKEAQIARITMSVQPLG
jgi:hypothetical protein